MSHHHQSLLSPDTPLTPRHGESWTTTNANVKMTPDLQHYIAHTTVLLLRHVTIIIKSEPTTRNQATQPGRGLCRAGSRLNNKINPTQRPSLRLKVRSEHLETPRDTFLHRAVISNKVRNQGMVVVLPPKVESKISFVKVWPKDLFQVDRTT